MDEETWAITNEGKMRWEFLDWLLLLWTQGIWLLVKYYVYNQAKKARQQSH